MRYPGQTQRFVYKTYGYTAVYASARLETKGIGRKTYVLLNWRSNIFDVYFFFHKKSLIYRVVSFDRLVFGALVDNIESTHKSLFVFFGFRFAHRHWHSLNY